MYTSNCRLSSRRWSNELPTCTNKTLAVSLQFICYNRTGPAVAFHWNLLSAFHWRSAFERIGAYNWRLYAGLIEATVQHIVPSLTRDVQGTSAQHSDFARFSSTVRRTPVQAICCAFVTRSSYVQGAYSHAEGVNLRIFAAYSRANCISVKTASIYKQNVRNVIEVHMLSSNRPCCGLPLDPFAGISGWQKAYHGIQTWIKGGKTIRVCFSRVKRRHNSCKRSWIWTSSHDVLNVSSKSCSRAVTVNAQG